MTTFINAQETVIDALIIDIITRVIQNLVAQNELSLESADFIKSQKSHDDADIDSEENDTNRSK